MDTIAIELGSCDLTFGSRSRIDRATSTALAPARR